MAVGGYELFHAGKNSSQTANQPGGPGGSSRFGSGQRTGRGNFKPTTGTIASISGQTLVITLADNTTKNIDCSNTSRISETQNGTTTQLAFADLKVGDKINVMGTDTNGTIAARMIFIGDMPTRGGGGGGYGGSGSGGQSNQNSVQGSQSS